jgi:Leucine-rich repeat (LRR) protein
VAGLSAVAAPSAEADCGLPKLKDLSLQAAVITDNGIAASLSKLTSLQAVNLSETQVTDAGIAHLSPLEQVEALHLSNTKLTNNCIKHLSQMKALNWVDIRGTQVTLEGIEQLKSQKPELRVIHTRA